MSHRAPDLVNDSLASWTVPTTGKGADSRVVANQTWHHNHYALPFVIMIRAEKLPAADAPGLIAAIKAAVAWATERNGAKLNPKDLDHDGDSQ